jgi:hypothetical protein
VLLFEHGETKLKEFNVTFEAPGSIRRLYHGIWLRNVKSWPNSQISTYKKIHRVWVQEQDRMLLLEGECGTVRILQVLIKDPTYPSRQGWTKLVFDSQSRPVCSMAFPNVVDPSSETWGADAQQILLVRWTPSKGRRTHRIFNNEWVESSARTRTDQPTYAYDSRISSDGPEDGFDFAFKAPFFTITVSATRVPDMSGQNRDIWAVDISAGTKAPALSPHYDDGCCC